jgi:hypothetical protein
MVRQGNQHRVDRVLGFFSSRPYWVSPTPSSAGERVTPPLVGGGGGGIHTHWRERECGGPNADEGIDTVVLWDYM